MQALLSLHAAWIEVDLDAIRHNLDAARALAAPNVRLAAVLKANAYGHGMIPVAETLLEAGADMLAVACLREALVLRRAFPKAPVLVMGLTPDPALETAVHAGIRLTVCDAAQAALLSRVACALACEACVHIKLDTGFHRIGLPADEAAVACVTAICALPGLRVEGLFTHLALKDEAADHAQVARFTAVTDALAREGVHIPLLHVADSITLVRYPAWQFSMARVGALLYGVRPTRTETMDFTLRRALCVKSRIVQISQLAVGEGVGYDYTFVAARPSRIATLPIGYGDGIPRCLSNRGEVSIRGERARIVGLLCMDQMMVDVTDIPQVRVGDTAVLLGGEGADKISYEEYSAWTRSNRNEPLSALGARLPRAYMRNGKICRVCDALLGEEEQV